MRVLISYIAGTTVKPPPLVFFQVMDMTFVILSTFILFLSSRCAQPLGMLLLLCVYRPGHDGVQIGRKSPRLFKILSGHVHLPYRLVSERIVSQCTYLVFSFCWLVYQMLRLRTAFRPFPHPKQLWSFQRIKSILI